MKPKYASMIVFALCAILSLLVGVVMSDFRDLMVKVFFAFGIFAAPIFIGEEAYDFIDKKIDKWIDRNERIEMHWHLIFALLIGTIHFVVWPALVVFFMNQADLRAWYQYLRPLDESIAWLGYPRYAYDFGILAFALSFAGYMYEWTSRQLKIWNWRRHHGQRRS